MGCKRVSPDRVRFCAEKPPGRVEFKSLRNSRELGRSLTRPSDFTVQQLYPAGWHNLACAIPESSERVPPGRVIFQYNNSTQPGTYFWRFSIVKRDFLKEENKKEKLGQLYSFSTAVKHTNHLSQALLEED